MEGTHGQLCTRLTDRLCCDDTNSLTDLYSLSCCQVGTITLCTNSHMGTATKNSTDLYCMSAHALKCIHNLCSTLWCYHAVFVNNFFSCIRINNCLCDKSAGHTLLKLLNNFLTIHKGTDFHIWNVLSFTTIHLTNHKLLRYINKTSCQVTRVSGTKCGIGHTLSCTMSGNEVLQYVKTFTEV